MLFIEVFTAKVRSEAGATDPREKSRYTSVVGCLLLLFPVVNVLRRVIEMLGARTAVCTRPVAPSPPPNFPYRAPPKPFAATKDL